VTSDALVVGAGISGLTTAVCLAEAGRRVRVITAEPIHETTSAAAGALWGPYLVESRPEILRWSRTSLGEFTELAADPTSGVRLTSGIEASRLPATPPDWGELLPDLRVCERSELPEGFVTGWRFTTPLIDMPVYLGYLRTRLYAAGGRIEQRAIGSLDEVAAPLIVNCAGTGAAALVDDLGLRPIHGQVVVVENPGITEFFVGDHGESAELLYVFPHGDAVLLGGTADPDRFDRRGDPDTAAAIIDRCAEIDPRLRTARILAHRTGLRPARAHLRVERERPGLLHNYGHGGAGVTLSWGCARDIATMSAND
jgi:D-amino-acid oxidase